MVIVGRQRDVERRKWEESEQHEGYLTTGAAGSEAPPVNSSRFNRNDARLLPTRLCVKLINIYPPYSVIIGYNGPLAITDSIPLLPHGLL